MSIELFLAIFSALATIPIYFKWFNVILQRNRARKIKSLRTQKIQLLNIKNDNGFFIRWAFESVVIILTLLSVALMFEGVAMQPEGQAASSLFISLMASISYIVCVFKLRAFSDLKNFDKTIQNIDRALEKLCA